MRKITKEEFVALEGRTREKDNPIKNALALLAIGEGVLVGSEEWKKSYSFSLFINNLNKNKRFQGMTFELKVMRLGKGWAVMRTS